MGLLFVFEDDYEAKGPKVDVSMASHAEIIEAARSAGDGLYPLIRRTNNYFNDVLFDLDELPALIDEMESLAATLDVPEYGDLIILFREALAQERGIETIAD